MAYTNIDDPSAHFQVKTYTGNSGVQFVTNDGNSDLQPDFVWIKNRTVGYSHQLYDSSRGTTKALFSDLSNAETTISNGLLTFNTDGFGVNSAAAVNENELVAWQWKANGGTTASNTDGSTTSTVQVNTDAGFSIVNYTVGIAGGNHSVGHGLGVAPNFILIKCRGAAQDWLVYHSSLGSGNYIKLNTTAGSVAYADSFGDGVTSSVFGYNYAGTSIANQPYVAYCFAEKQGYSKFGSYIANANTNGTFVYTGFKPAFIIFKNTQQTTNWAVYDVKRDSFNVATNELQPNTTAAANDAIPYSQIDILSNGIKMRNNNGLHTNAFSGQKIIYMAFAEHPFVTSTGIPTTAR